MPHTTYKDEHGSPILMGPACPCIKMALTTMPYGCKININGVLNGHENSDVKVMILFNTNQGSSRSHGTRNYHRPTMFT